MGKKVVKRIYDDLWLKFSRSGSNQVKKLILDFLYEKPNDLKNINDFVSKKGRRRHSHDIPSKVDKALEYLKEHDLVKEIDNLFCLTESGNLKIKQSQERRHRYTSWAKAVTNPKLSLIFFVLGYLGLYLLKLFGYIHTGNLIFLADGFSSVFGVLTIFILSVAFRIKHDTIIIRLIQVVYVFSGTMFFLIGIYRTLNPVQSTNTEISLLIVGIAIIFGLILFLYLWSGSSVNKELKIKVFAKKIKGDWFLPTLVLIPIVAEFFGINFFEGLITITYGIVIMGEAVRINLERYTRHVLMFLNEKPYSYDEILKIDSRIAMLFGAPMFLDEARDPTHTWWNEIGLAHLQKKGYIKREGDIYSLTKEGKQPASDASQKMIWFLRIIFSFAKPAFSPILSLFLHLFLGSLKLLGFLLTGSISLLGDGLDSAIDGVSSIIVGFSIRVRKETQATYVLIILMCITGISVLFSSIDRILRPVALEEEIFAIMIAVLSILLCLLLYLYQRYSGYINQSLAILAQSEDSKNHVLNAFLVLIAIAASSFQLYFVDGLVGCFIGIVILKGAYEIFQDLRSVSHGERIDFEKYKLGVWKAYNRFQDQMLANWILYQILKGTNNLSDLGSTFNQFFSPLTIYDGLGGSFTVKYSFNENSFQDQINDLLEKELLHKEDEILSLTDEGTRTIDKAIARHRGRF